MKFTYTASLFALVGLTFLDVSQVSASTSLESDLKSFLTVDMSKLESQKETSPKTKLSITERFQRILDLSNIDKSFIEKSSAGPESAFCKEFERDENTHKFTPSVFHTPMGKEGGKCELKDKDGKTLVKVSCDLKKNCLMQGVCILDHKDGRRIGYNFIKFNYTNKTIFTKTYTNAFAGKSSLNQPAVSPVRTHVVQTKQSVFAEFDNSRCPFGYGIWSEEHQTSICMDPFRSVAADTKYHKAGDVLFFPALRGLVLPDNSVHNGFMTVRSAGGRIKGQHRFDFYTGICNKNHEKKLLCQDYGPKVFSEIGFGGYLKRKDKSCFYSYYKINDELKDFVLTERNFPNLPESLVQNTIVETWGNFISFNSAGETMFSAPEQQINEDALFN